MQLLILVKNSHSYDFIFNTVLYLLCPIDRRELTFHILCYAHKNLGFQKRKKKSAMLQKFHGYIIFFWLQKSCIKLFYMMLIVVSAKICSLTFS